MSKILIVEDDAQLAQIVGTWLREDHHIVEICGDGKDALELLKVYDYDLVILDLSLPGVDGMEVLRDFRSRGRLSPVLILTGKNSIADVENGLNAGADDYLTKPFHGRELVARLRALLRRPPAYTGNVLQLSNLVLDREKFCVRRDQEDIPLLAREFQLLEFLMRNPNKLFPPDVLLNRVWSNESDATIDAVTSCIKRLRKKIDQEGKPSLIKTVRGVGYKLEA